MLFSFVSMISDETNRKYFHTILCRGISHDNMNTITQKQNELRFAKNRKVSLSEAINCIVKEYREYIGQIKNA